MYNDDDDGLLQLALSIAPKLEDCDRSEANETNAFNQYRNNANLQQGQLDGVVSDDDASANGDDNSNNEKVADVFSKQVPANFDDLERADSEIASQMAKLSVTDREEVYMDVHGVSPDFVPETPELIHLSLLDLQNEIELLSDKRAYDIAERMSSNYVHNQGFRLMFLRCEKFDCPKTALRIIRHFQMKMDLFGVDKLVTDITQDDLDAEDMEVLHICFGRCLPKFDRGGRLINFVLSIPQTFKTDACLRKGFYNVMAAFRDDEEVQRRGAVSVIFQAKGTKSLQGSPELIWKLAKLNEGSPMRFPSVHICLCKEVVEEQTGKEGLARLKTSYNESVQVRNRVHHGTVQECLEILKGYGIDPSCIPINDDREITDLLEEHQRLEERRRYERLNFPLRSTIHVPFSADVLLGKGTPIQNHTGNKGLRKLISDRIKLYDKSQRGEKKEIAMEIIDTIKKRGGLFLKQDGGKWSPVNDDVARLKVTAAFRTYRQSLKQSWDD